MECVSCGAVFNYDYIDYKETHKNKKHDRPNVRVKMVGAPENPFAASKRKKDHLRGWINQRVNQGKWCT